MPTIAIRLDPQRLKNPDADLRYEIPNLLCDRSGGTIQDDGYDYEPVTTAMLIYLRVDDVNAALPYVVNLLEQDRLHGNVLKEAATVGVAEVSGNDMSECRVVYPSHSQHPD